MQQRLDTRVNKVSVAEQLQTMSSAQVGGLVTADELTGGLMGRCVDWTPADFEDAKLLVNDYLYALQNDGFCVRVNRGIWKATSTPAARANLAGTTEVSVTKDSVMTQQDSINLQTANIQSESTPYGQASAAAVVAPVPTPRRKDRGDQDRLSQQQKRRSSSSDRERRLQVDKIVRCCLCRQNIENPGQPITCGQFSLTQLLDKLTEVRPEISSQIDNIRNELMVSETTTDQQRSQTTDRTRRPSRQSGKRIVCYLCKKEIENPGQPISCGQFNLKQLLDKVTELQPGMFNQITSQLAPVAEHAESKSTRVARQFEQQVAVPSQKWAAESLLSGPTIQQQHEIQSGRHCRCSICHQTVQDRDAVTCGTNNLEQLLRMLSDALDAEAMAAGGQFCTHRTPGAP